MARLWRHLEDESGQAIIVGSIMLVVLLAVGAVVFDYGAGVTQRRNMQNVADAAALAGAQELDGTTTGQTNASAKATEYINKNVSDLVGSPEITFNDEHTAITVKVAKTSASFFLGSFGLGDNDIGAHATARIAAPLLPGPGVVPLGIDLQTYTNCTAGCTLKEYSGNNDNPRNNYGLLDLGGVGGGAQEVCSYLIGGSTVGITDPDNLKSGNVSSLHNCLVDRYTAANAQGSGTTHPPRCVTWDEVTDNDILIDACNPLSGARRGADSAYPAAQPTMVIVIPVVVDFDQTGCDTNPKCFDIVGADGELRTFAIFLIDAQATVLGPNPTCNVSGQCWITGRFIREWQAPVSTNYDVETGDWDPNALLKIVQLVD